MDLYGCAKMGLASIRPFLNACHSWIKKKFCKTNHLHRAEVFAVESLLAHSAERDHAYQSYERFGFIDWFLKRKEQPGFDTLKKSLSTSH